MSDPKNVKPEDLKKPTAAAPSDSKKTEATAKESKASEVKKEDVKASADPKKETAKTSADSKESSAQAKESKSEKTAEQKSAEGQNTEQKPAEQKAEQKQEAQKPTEQKPKQEEGVKLNSLFAFKVGMTNVYEKNQMVPVTVLRYKTARVTQIKTKEKEGYTAVQTALESSKKATKTLANHLKKAGFKNKAVYIKETRGPLPEGIKEGQKVSLQSLQKGDRVLVSGTSKGHGFAGVVKRWGFGGGPASHGAEKHRTTGSIANTATQGRVFPGKKMPGHFGCDRITQKSRVVDVLPEQSAILIQGSVPGAKNSLIEIRKQKALR